MTKINQKGFTLVELMVVIAIIAVLSMIGITVFRNAQVGSRDAKRRADIQSISSALEQRSIPGTGYPAAVDDAWFSSGATPVDPSTGGDYTGITGIGATYCVCADLEADSGNSNANDCSAMVTDNSGDLYCQQGQQ